MISLGGLSVETLCEKLMWLCEIRKYKNQMGVPVKFYRMVDGKPEHVATAGGSQWVPIDFIYSGIDWDMNTTFVHTPIPLYADWDNYLAFLEEQKEGRDETHD